MREWKCIHEPDRLEDPYRIYQVGEMSARLVAKCERKEDAELIVRLHETKRKALSPR